MAQTLWSQSSFVDRVVCTAAWEAYYASGSRVSPVCSAVSQSGPLLHPASLQLKRIHSCGEGGGSQSSAGNRPRGQRTGLDPGRVTLSFRTTNLGNHTKKVYIYLYKHILRRGPKISVISSVWFPFVWQNITMSHHLWALIDLIRQLWDFVIVSVSRWNHFSPLKSNHFSHTWERSMRSCALRWAGTARGAWPLLGRTTAGEMLQ